MATFYLSVTLADRSGQLQANMWDNVTDAIDAFEQDDFVKVKGMIHSYNGRWQLTIHKVRKLEEAEIDYSDYLPKTTKDIEQLWRNAGRLRRQLRESLAEVAAEGIHGRRGHRHRVQERACGQDAASCLRRRTARPRGFAVYRLRPCRPATIPR